jgi:hypothetical protein
MSRDGVAEWRTVDGDARRPCHGYDGAAITHAVLHVTGTSLTVLTDANGGYRMSQLPAGTEVIVARAFGFAPDSERVTAEPGAAISRNLTMHASTQRLAEMVVRESPRMAETKAAALAKQQNADNFVAVLSGDEIRALPHFNAAEAAGRVPGVWLERDEGEGEFVQVRGTEPRLSNVTINGVHVPGTEADRIPKLDDVPSDLLGAIEVSKTLTADMDADAIDGSINLVTKTPEGRPRGYIAGQYGQSICSHETRIRAGSPTGATWARLLNERPPHDRARLWRRGKRAASLRSRRESERSQARHPVSRRAQGFHQPASVIQRAPSLGRIIPISRQTSRARPAQRAHRSLGVCVSV